MPLSHLADWYVPTELQALYTESGLTYGLIAAKLGVSVRTIGNYLTGETRPKLAMAAKFAEVCGGSEKRTNFLIHVISQMDLGKIVSDLDERNIFIVELAEATYGEMWEWEPWYIPGLLQNEEYHLEVLPEQGRDPMQNWQRKKRRFLRAFQNNPGLAMKFLVSANAMRQTKGWSGADRLIEHLLHLDQHPNCEIRIIDGLHHGVEHSFTIFNPAKGPKSGPRFAYVEAIDQSRHIEEPVKLALYDDRIRGMWPFGERIGRWLDGGVH
jgi:transcriptional regulator with XRE-family HTH domain